MTPKQAKLLTDEIRRIREFLEASIDRLVVAISKV